MDEVVEDHDGHVFVFVGGFTFLTVGVVLRPHFFDKLLPEVGVGTVAQIVTQGRDHDAGDVLLVDEGGVPPLQVSHEDFGQVAGPFGGNGNSRSLAFILCARA